MGVVFDFSDIEKGIDDFQKEVNSAFVSEGEEFVDDARKTGSYQDRTGHLRASNYYKAEKDGIEFGNSADYASYVESKGYEVSTSAALRAIERLKMRFE